MNDFPRLWTEVQENFLVKCKHCKLEVNYASISLTYMKYHTEKHHPEKVTWVRDEI